MNKYVFTPGMQGWFITEKKTMLHKMKNFKSIILSKRSRDRSPDFMEMLEMRNIIDLQWQMVAMVVAMVPDPRQMSSMYMRASDL